MNTHLPLDLRKLRHAIVLAEFGSFARASRELHITQSALTRSIQALESDLGVELFDRLPSGVKPSIVGRNLLARAQSLLLQANGLRCDARLLRDARLGTLTLGMGPMLVPWLGPTLSTLIDESPHLTIRVEIEPVHRLIEMLLAEELEFFVADVSQLAKDTRVVQEKIGAMQINYFVRREHPLASRRKLALPEIQQFPLITPRFREPGNAPPGATDWAGRISCENVDMLKTIALNSDGVLFASSSAVIQELNARKLVKLRVPDSKDWTSDVRVVALANRSRSPLAQRIIAELEKMPK